MEHNWEACILLLNLGSVGGRHPTLWQQHLPNAPADIQLELQSLLTQRNPCIARSLLLAASLPPAHAKDKDVIVLEKSGARVYRPLCEETGWTLEATTSTTVQVAVLSMLSDAVLGDNIAQACELGYYQQRLMALQATSTRFTLVPFLLGRMPMAEVHRHLAASSAELCHPLLAVYRWCRQLERRFLNLQVMRACVQDEESPHLFGLEPDAVRHLYEQLRALQLNLMKDSMTSHALTASSSCTDYLGSSTPEMSLHSLMGFHLGEPDLPDSKADVEALLDEVDLRLLSPSLERDLFQVVCFLNLSSLSLRDSRVTDDQLTTLMGTLTLNTLYLERCTALQWLLKPADQERWQHLARLSLVDLSIRRLGARRSMFGTSLLELPSLVFLELQHLPLVKELGVKVQEGCEVLIASCPYLSNWTP